MPISTRVLETSLKYTFSYHTCRQQTIGGNLDCIHDLIPVYKRIIVNNYMVFLTLQSIADYFTEGQPRFNWLSMETGAMGIGGLNGVWMENSLFSLFWDILHIFFLAFLFFFLFLFLITFWEMGGGEWRETTNQSTMALFWEGSKFAPTSNNNKQYKPR